jgi:hypothetical protein
MPEMLMPEMMTPSRDIDAWYEARKLFEVIEDGSADSLQYRSKA